MVTSVAEQLLGIALAVAAAPPLQEGLCDSATRPTSCPSPAARDAVRTATLLVEGFWLIGGRAELELQAAAAASSRKMTRRPVEATTVETRRFEESDLATALPGHVGGTYRRSDGSGILEKAGQRENAVTAILRRADEAAAAVELAAAGGAASAAESNTSMVESGADIEAATEAPPAMASRSLLDAPGSPGDGGSFLGVEGTATPVNATPGVQGEAISEGESVEHAEALDFTKAIDGLMSAALEAEAEFVGGSANAVGGVVFSSDGELGDDLGLAMRELASEVAEASRVLVAEPPLVFASTAAQEILGHGEPTSGDINDLD